MSRWVTVVEPNGHERRITRAEATAIMQSGDRSYRHGGWMADGSECLVAEGDMTWWNGATNPRNTHIPGCVRS